MGACEVASTYTNVIYQGGFMKSREEYIRADGLNQN